MVGWWKWQRREGLGRRSFFGLRTLKNGECHNEIKKKCGKRAREKWVKVRTDDKVKNEEGEENPV